MNKIPRTISNNDPDLQALKEFQHKTTFKMSNKVKITQSILNQVLSDELNNQRIKDPQLRAAKEQVIKLISFEAYCESSPQAILQMYTLWKKPQACFEWNFTTGKYKEIIKNVVT